MVQKCVSRACLQTNLWSRMIPGSLCSEQHNRIARTWRQPQCALTDEWIKKLRCIQWSITQPQKNEIPQLAATGMSLAITIASGVDQETSTRSHHSDVESKTCQTHRPAR